MKNTEKNALSKEKHHEKTLKGTKTQKKKLLRT